MGDCRRTEPSHRKHPLTLSLSKCEPHTPPRPNSPAPDPAPSPLAGEGGGGGLPPHRTQPPETPAHTEPVDVRALLNPDAPPSAPDLRPPLPSWERDGVRAPSGIPDATSPR